MAIAVLPDGSRRELPDGSTVMQLAESIGKGLAKAAVVGKVDDKVVDLSFKLTGEHNVSIITDRDPIALQTLRHSTAHVMAEAIQRLWPQAKLAYGPPLENGFYYDLSLDTPISSSDFEKIEAEMKKIVAENRPFTRYELSFDDGINRLRTEGNKYKIDNAERAKAAGSQSLSWYATGEKDKNWEDLCMGPHVPATGKIGAFKVTSVAASNWHGDITSDRFQRVYGTAFFDKKQLDEYLKQIDEAKKRDHRVLGPQLGLFAIDDKVGQGLVLWKPKGAEVRIQLQNFISEHLRRQGYRQVFTPHIGRLDLYRTSGHYPYYRESQFPPLIDREQIDLLAKENCGCAELSNRMEKGEIDGYLLKPMNCPHHIRIYASDQHSYRDLPIRLAEFGTVYRWEKSGELGGMTRVRGFTQDDAHLFCMEDQVPAEILGCLELVKIVLGTLGMNEYRVRVGLRDPDSAKYVGKADQWDRAEAACKSAAESLGVKFTLEPGEAAFYGPKIDFVVRDIIGREWQLGTVQVDYQLPERFDLSYIGADNKPHRPVMIHRAPFGSMERFIGVLIEHFAGAFPLWLAPVQVAVLSISEKFNDYATKSASLLQQAGLRIESNLGSEKIGAKIRTATMGKIPYMLVIGEKEQAENKVAVRHRTEGDKGVMPVEQIISQLKSEIADRK
ncbi:MAG TPA: threonine--tRNA ligase [Tepidisphaeraceae bacterium]|jgi:threonyl-tRNA synthetase|nr:threonine--tRNA ligase [Tepidisphaeraceae bacterium]